jgi:hypothetical protein
MRKIQAAGIAGLLLCLLCVNELSAQAGLKGGVNFSTLSQKGAGLVSLTWGSLTGFTVGGFYEFDVNEILAIQPELLYSRKGGQLEAGILGVLGSKSLAIHYLEVPVLLKLKFPTQSGIVPNVFAGPYGSLKLSVKGEIKVLGVELEEDVIGIKDSDFGFVFGGGLDFKVSNATVILDVRYDLGLVNIAEPLLGVENEIKTRSLIVMVGFGF